MGKEQWQAVFVIGAILLVGFFFQPAREEASGKAVQLLEDEDAAQQPADQEAIQQPGGAVQRASSLPPLPPPSLPPVCDAFHEYITQQFLQKMGVTTPHTFDSFIKLINDRYLAVTATPNIGTAPELYLYDLGSDGRFNTPDDTGFLIEPLQSSVLHLDSLTSGGVTTLFWYTFSGGTSILKQCILTSQGCTPTTITTLPLRLKGLVASSSTNRLFSLYLSQGGIIGLFYMNIVSCSLQSGTSDSCGNGLSSFITHQQLSMPYRAIGYNVFSLSEVGFYLADPGVVPLQNFIIDINQPTVYIPIQNQLNPTSKNPLAPPFFFSIDSTNSDSPQLVMVDSTIGTISPLESIPSSSLWRSLAIQGIQGFPIITLYYELTPLSSVALMGKRVGSPPVELGTFTTTLYPQDAITLPDLTVLGILSTATSSSGNLVKFRCSP